MKEFWECQTMRRKLVKTSKLNLVTGKTKEVSEKWVDEICGIPLFGKDEKIKGKCKSCKKGWTHKNNYKI